MRLTINQWEAIDKLGNVYSLQTKPTVTQKIKAFEKLAMTFTDSEAHEVACATVY